ncbi:MAG: MerR family transcriptional regulator [Streptosporangiaceae bacterium]
MSVQPARGYLGISEVLAQLRADYADISVSKIRFLETEGLIAPARSPAGYRRFCAADVQRLKYILAAQRDQYLPLRVIKDRLARLDQADSPPEARPAGARPDDARLGQPAAAALTRRELVEAAGMSDALLTELETFGLLRRVGRHYGADALQVAQAAVALTAYGVEARHLRAVRAAAERETAMIESLVAPIMRQRGAGARELAGRTAGEVTALVLRLHSALVDGALAEAGLAQPAAAEPGRGQDTSCHGMEGASA